MTSLEAAEPVFVNVYGLQESIPGLPKKVYKYGLWYRIYTVHASASLCNILIRINSIQKIILIYFNSHIESKMYEMSIVCNISCK